MGRMSIQAAAVLALLAPFAAPAQSPATLDVKLEQSVIVPTDDATELYALIRLTGAPEPEQTPDFERPRLNLGLTLDRSGSMGDARKWDYVLDATGKVIDRLDERDLLSVSSYNNNAKTLFAQDSLRNPEKLKAILARIYPDGGTNISAGLKNNARILSFGKTKDRLSRIILMSDGLANDGISDEAGMRKLVARIAEGGSTVSAIGLGADYDEAMLRAIAEAGGGNYYYVESPSQAQYIFDQEVRGLFQIVAQELRLNLVGSEGVKAELLNPIDLADKAYGLGSLRHDEDITLVAKFILPRVTSSELVEIGTVQVTMKDRETGKLILLEETLRIPTGTVEQMDASLDAEVKTERGLVEIELGEIEAARLAAAGDFEGAKKAYGTLKDTATGFVAFSRTLSSVSDEQLLALEAKTEALALQEERMDAPAPQAAASVKSGNQALFYAQKGQRALSYIKPGDAGFAVENLQRALNNLGFEAGDVDGVFDVGVEEALREFQSANQLKTDGIAGPVTLSKLGLY